MKAGETATRISRRGLVRRGAALGAGLALGGPASALAGAGRPSSRGPGSVAETILRNGRVHTLARPGRAEAVAISGGRVALVGSNTEVEALAGAGTEVIDLAGRMLIPGIHDGHTHPLYGGLALTQPTLDYRQLELAQFVAAVAKLLERNSDEEPDGWLSVDLWDASAMKRQPTRHDLDPLPTARPIAVFALDGHLALANSRALAIAGIDASTPDPPGGRIKHDRNGEPTGILLDDAIALLSDAIPPLTAEQNGKALAAAHAEMASRGVTSYLDAWVRTKELAAHAALADQGPLTARPSVSINVDPGVAEEPAEMLAYVEDLRSTYARPGITIRSVKMFFDGVIEHPTQTAALLRPYRVNKGTKRDPEWVPGESSGPTYFRQRVANAAIAALDAAGWQVHVHAIGDRAVRSALDAFERARQRNGPSDNRHTICHLELVHPRDFRRFERLGVLANMQLQWAERDDYTVKLLRPYLGRERWRHTYPAGSLAKAGALLCGGSDWPVDPLLPFRQIEMAVNRTADEVYPGSPKPLFAAQGLGLRDSIAMHTANSAYQLHQESLSGRIAPGFAADLIALDRDLFEVGLERVSKTKVDLTMTGGRIVHRSARLG